MTLATTDAQLCYIMAACQPLEIEKRDTFLRRLVAILQIRDRLRRPTDDDIAAGCRQALAGLVHAAIAAD